MLHHVNAEDINHKYAKSIIFYKGDPVMCAGAVGEGIAYEKLGPKYREGEQQLGKADDDDFSDGPFKLGWLNGIGAVDDDGNLIKSICYVSRAPVRRWKQGLSSENLVFVGSYCSFNNACRMPEFVDMLKGKYPSYTQGWKVLSKDIRRIAYSRHFAIGIGKLDQMELYYRGQLVGQGEDAKHIKLAAKYQFLQEAYELSRAA